jgi:hypothetical protein
MQLDIFNKISDEIPLKYELNGLCLNFSDVLMELTNLNEKPSRMVSDTLHQRTLETCRVSLNVDLWICPVKTVDHIQLTPEMECSGLRLGDFFSDAKTEI